MGLISTVEEVHSTMLNVAIVEDDKEIRDVISNYLNGTPDISCDIAVESVELLLSLSKDAAYPDVVLMDIGLPGISGIEGIRMIKRSHPDTDVLMLTVYDDAHRVFESLRAGASGYLLKNTPLPEIKAAIKTLHSGGAPMSPQIARKVIAFFAPQQSTSPSPLSLREQEIVIGLVDGLSYKMIADRLHIATETVRFHIKNIYRKLHVHSKGEVISKSFRGEI